ncbi:hypothetical protein SLEP1_g33052 [Rubroshorea leprosula]|uniref:Uncharacterized protein n=1 Tax=Rubroshorea leprosula TaxID=152421 RepID=A0AAV5KFE7_9ROSI|nr:hypothetical protein SLEP1_g33052 [Rubroshorea leprosula]
MDEHENEERGPSEMVITNFVEPLDINPAAGAVTTDSLDFFDDDLTD